MLNTPELIRRKREGKAISVEELKEFVDGYVDGSIPDYQVSAFLMAVFFQGMAPGEAAALTQSMLESGDRFDLSDIEGPKVDKHSTGGVGDKVSMVLAPLIAAAGGIVPMVSGRGLGHTGGTLDKLDSIPGYRWGLDETEMKKILSKVGCVIIGQTDNFVPADKKLYALRDVTATVESVPLICGSILSKKVAAGTDYLVMDVKTGSGAFMDSVSRANELAEGLTSIGRALGKKVSAILTQMNQPLGIAVGNALEMHEVIELLKGKGPDDVREITLQLCAEMLRLAGIEEDLDSAYTKLVALLDSGKALEKFTQWVEAQGGDPRIVDTPALMAVSSQQVDVLAPHDGFITSIMTRQIGVAANTLGAGRMAISDPVDTSVGLLFHRKVADWVKAGDPIATLIHRDNKGVEQATAMILEAVEIGDEKIMPLPFILGSVLG